VCRLSARWFVALAILAIPFSGERAPLEAQNSPTYSESSLSGTFVFRTRGSSLFTLPGELTSSPVYLASIGLVIFDGRGLLRGSVANSATRTEIIPAGKYVAPYIAAKFCATRRCLGHMKSSLTEEAR